MITVILPTANRPQTLRTALSSVEAQTEKDKIACVIVSENGGTNGSAEVCAEFSSLPIRYIFRDPATDAMVHGVTLFAEAARLPSPYVAVLHDDDWWAANHLGNAIRHLHANEDAVSYWSSSFVVDAERAWPAQCWSIQCWMAAGFPPVNSVARLGPKEAALASIGCAAAHYSSLIAEKHALAEAYLEASKTGNLLDNDRLLFLELARRGSLLFNFVPEVFVRKHPGQAQRTFSSRKSRAHTAATTRTILQFCKEEGLDLVAEFVRLYEECPAPAQRPELMEAIKPGVMQELRRHNPRAVSHLLRRHHNAKWFTRQLCPPFLWETARQVKTAMVG